METDNDATRAAPVNTFDSAKRLLGSIIAHLQTRLALFSTEFAEEKLRLTSLLYSVILAVFFFFSTLLLVLLFVIAAYWDTPYRLHAIGALTLLFLTGGGIAWRRARNQLLSKPRLFEASLAELYRDRQQLDSKS